MTDINATIETISTGVSQILEVNQSIATMSEMQTALILILMLLSLIMFNRRV